ncbi:MAG: STAS domain-containing protein [Candidatus Auribacterota bacterium]|nr:STAS domain-containing protein [Candidatus Auribacterota bacterium]
MADIMRIDISDNKASVSFLQNEVKFDLDLADELDSVIRKLYNDNVFRIELDFQNIAFVTSLVLGKLVSYHRDLSAKNGELRIINAQQSIIDVFSVTKIDRLIPVSASR